MDNQERIMFESLHYKHKGGWWRECPPKSLGNVIHWLYVYEGLNLAENVTVGDGTVKYRGELLCRFLYEDDSDIPHFYDLKIDYHQTILDNQKKYLDGLKKFPKFVEDIDNRYEEMKNLIFGKKEIK